MFGLDFEIFAGGVAGLRRLTPRKNLPFLPRVAKSHGKGDRAMLSASPAMVKTGAESAPVPLSRGEGGEKTALGAAPKAPGSAPKRWTPPSPRPRGRGEGGAKEEGL